MRQEHLGVNSILEGPILHQLLMLFWPILLGTFFQQLYNTADAIIVGQYVGAAGLAAVGGSTGTIISLVVNLLVGVGVGTSVAVAQSYGARRFEDVSRAVHTSVALNVGVVYGGMNLYNNGFAGGMVAIFLVPVIQSIRDRAARARGEHSL